jgi:hypothetical protein
LRQRLEREKEATQRLREIAEMAKREVERALNMSERPDGEMVNGRRVVPKWIKLLNEYANKSATIRRNARQKAILAVDEGRVMNFKDRLLFFTSMSE